MEQEKIKEYQRKPKSVKAYQITRELLEGILFDGKPYPDGLRMRSKSIDPVFRKINAWFGSVVTIHNQETQVIEGDWIVQEKDGIHYYPVKPDIFEESFVINSPSVAPTEEKPEYFIWDGINRDFEEVPNLDKAEKTIREWISQDGDIHPDSELVFVFQKVSVPVITETGEFTTNNEGEPVPICNISFNRVAPKEGWVKVEEVDWDKIREKFFKELTTTKSYGVTGDVDITEFNTMPHNVFKWFKEQILFKTSK